MKQAPKRDAQGIGWTRQASISVIISTYNRAATLADCLLSLQRQTHSAFEVIVVVGPCTDSTFQVLAEHGSRCKVVPCPERNLSHSRNLGIAAAAGEICAFIDDDAVAHPRWLERLATAYADPMVGGAGGFTVDNTGVAFQCRYTVCDRFGNATLLNHIDPATRLDQAGLWLFPSLLGTNSSFRTVLLTRIGGFDPCFEYMLDETDVCLRLVDLGMAVVTIPEAWVFHRYAESHVRDHRRIARTLIAPSRSKAHFVFKHACGRMPLTELSGELDRFRADLQFSNRWHVDRAMIDSRHFLRLNADVETGLQQGIETGVKAGASAARFTPTLIGPETSEKIGGEPSVLCLFPIPAVFPSGVSQLRIALVSQGYPPRDTAGIARWTQELAQALAARGHHVHVITASDGPRHIDYRHGVWIHAVPPEHDCRESGPVELPPGIHARAAAVLSEAQRIRREFGLDLLSAPIWDVEGILCAAHLDLPVVTSLHTAYRMVLPMKKQWRSDLSFRLHHVEKVIAAETWLLRHARLLLANSHEISVELEALYGIALDPLRVATVPHGLAPLRPTELAVLPRPLPDLPGETERCQTETLQIGGDVVRVLFVGRIERRKGLDLLLRALMPLWDEFPSLQLDVVGAAVPEEAAYATEIADLVDDLAALGCSARATFHGHVAEAALLAHYACCDVFVAPSRFESFGLIAIEAMRLGRPVVATRVGGLSEIVEHAVSGLLVEPESIGDLSLALRELLSDGANRRRMGRNAAAAFAAKYTASTMAEAVEGSFAALLAPGRGHEVVPEAPVDEGAAEPQIVDILPNLNRPPVLPKAGATMKIRTKTLARNGAAA